MLPIRNLDAAVKKYKANYPIELNKNRSTTRRKKKEKEEPRKKGRSFGKQKERVCDISMSLGGMAIDGE